MDLKNIKIGSDPEFLATDGTNLVPSYKFLPGTKHDPFNMGNGYFVQRDNVLVEGNIPPATTDEQFEFNMISLKEQITNNFLKTLGLSLISRDSGTFIKEDLQHPEALELGCSPFDTVWETKDHVQLSDLKYSLLRPVGFHIHVGYEFTNKEDVDFKKLTDIVIAKLFDYFVIIPSYSISKDEFRQKYYGGLGKIRHKSYGVELRSLGGYFTQTKYFRVLFNQIITIIDLIADDDIFFSVLQTSSIADLKNIEKLTTIKEQQNKILINL